VSRVGSNVSPNSTPGSTMSIGSAPACISSNHE
jgi:hypothetical protein